jgi:hypothetical protein
MATNQFCVPQFEFKEDTCAEDFIIWRAQFEAYLIASEIDISNETEAKLATSVLITVGGRHVVQQLMRAGINWQKQSYEDMMKRLNDRYVKTNAGLALVRFVSCTIKDGEKMSDYVARLQTLANIADKNKAEDIREKLIGDTTIIKKYQKFHSKLVHEADWSLDKLIDWQTTEELQQEMVQKAETEGTSLNTLQVPRHRNNSSSSNNSKYSTSSRYSNNSASIRSNTSRRSTQTCWFCGGRWPHGNKRCPASDAKCHNCHTKGHFAKFCTDKSKGNNYNPKLKRKINKVDDNDKKTHSSQSHNESTSSVDMIYKIDLIERKCPKQTLCVNGNTLISIYPDTGAHANVIPHYELKNFDYKPQLRNTSVKLMAFNANTPLEVMGEFDCLATWEGTTKKITFIVLKTDRKVDTIISYETMLDFDVDFNKILKCPIKRIGEIDMLPYQREANRKSIHISGKTIRHSMPQLFEKRTGEVPNYKVNIRYDSAHKPIRVPPQFIPMKLMKPAKAKLDKWVNDKIARKLKQGEDITWVSSLYPIEKDPSKTGELQPDDVRLVVNCRNVNKAITRENYMQLPDQRRIEYDLTNAQIFSKIDIRDAFSTLVLDDESSKLFTFTTPWGLYRLNRLVQGVSVSSEIFQEFIDLNFGHIPNTKRCVDDFLIYGKPDPDKVGTPEEYKSAVLNHNKSLMQVLKRCLELNLTLNDQKCLFSVSSVIFYGNEISSKGFRPLKSKVEPFLHSKNPTNKQEVRSFLGMCANWIKRLPEIATEAKLLNSLRKKHAQFNWQQQHTDALNSIRNKLLTGHLAHFNESRATEIYCDAGPGGISAIMVQTDKNGTKWLIACATHCFTDIEMRYSQIEKEMLAIIWTIKHFRYECLANNVTIKSDSLSSVKIMNATNKQKETKSLRILSWLSQIPGGHYKIEFVPGNKNIADYLSRCHPDTKSPSFNDLTTIYTITESITHEINMEQLIHETNRDTTLIEIKQHLANKTRPPPSNIYHTIFNDLKINENGCIQLNNKLILPESLIDKALHIAHLGHNGTPAMLDILKKRYHFRNMNNIIKNFVKQCWPCQCNTGHPATEPMIVQPAPHNNNDLVSLDFSSKTPSNNYILVWNDERSKFTIMKVSKGLTSKNAIDILKRIFNEYKMVPKTVKSDNGPAFKSKEFAAFLKQYNINHQKVTPLWPNANGGCESRMKIINKSIRCANVNNKSHWTTILDNALKVYNASKHPSTGYSPNELMCYDDNLKLASFHRNNTIDAKQLQSNIQTARQKYKTNADKNKKAKTVNFEIGDKIIHKWQKTNKHQPKYDPQPYKVTQQHGTMIIAERPNHTLTRNKSFFKKIQPITQITAYVAMDPLARRRARLAQERAQQQQQHRLNQADMELDRRIAQVQQQQQQQQQVQHQQQQQLHQDSQQQLQQQEPHHQQIENTNEQNNINENYKDQQTEPEDDLSFKSLDQETKTNTNETTPTKLQDKLKDPSNENNEQLNQKTPNQQTPPPIPETNNKKPTRPDEGTRLRLEAATNKQYSSIAQKSSKTRRSTESESTSLKREAPAQK